MQQRKTSQRACRQSQPCVLHISARALISATNKPPRTSVCIFTSGTIMTTATTGTRVLGKPNGASYDENNYSHATIFSDSNIQESKRQYDWGLTKVCTPRIECVDGWMLAGGQTVTTYGPPIFPEPTQLYSLSVQNITVFRLSLGGAAIDPYHQSCQPVSGNKAYCPGVYPSGQTIAEITEWEVYNSGGVSNRWQASCCKRYVVLKWDEEMNTRRLNGLVA